MAFRGGGRGGGRGGSGFRGRGGGGDRGGRGGFASRGGGRGGARGGGRGGISKPGGRGGPRGGGRGGRGGAPRGRGGPSKPIVTPHRHEGVFVTTDKGEDQILTLSAAPGFQVYNEQRVQVDVQVQNEDGTTSTQKLEYRKWNPFRSKLCAGIIRGLDNIYMKPGSKVLYLGAASGTTVSHVADIVGPTGIVYAVEFSNRPGIDLLGMSSRRPRVCPIVADARKPEEYETFVGMVDCIFADVAQPDQVRIVALNAAKFLKIGGGCIITIKANCIDSTIEPAKVYASQVELMRKLGIKPKEQLDLVEFQRDHAIVVGEYVKCDDSAVTLGSEEESEESE